MRLDKAEISNCLFVALPLTHETFAVHGVPNAVSVISLRARLELVAGLAAETYQLYYGRTRLANNFILTFGENVQNGTQLTVVINDPWRRLYEAALCRRSVQQILKRYADAEMSMNDVNDGHFVALFALSHRGLHQVAKRLIDHNTCILRKQTVFGRTALHAAAAEDRVEMVHALVIRCANIRAIDVFRRTPLDVAIGRSASVCERVLRNALSKRHCACVVSDVTRGEKAECKNESTPCTVIPINDACNNTDEKVKKVAGQMDQRTTLLKPTLLDCESLSRTKLDFNAQGQSKKVERNRPVSSPTSLRVQSAKYYRSKHHYVVDPMSIARPSTATSRYRSWKTWLMDKDKDAIDRRQRNMSGSRERQIQSADAFRQWLVSKIQQSRADDFSATDSDNDYSTMRGNITKQRTLYGENSQAFLVWLDRKQETFAEMKKHKRDVELGRFATVEKARQVARRHKEEANMYAKAYDDWLTRRRQFDCQTTESYDDGPEVLTRKSLDEYRKTLQREGMTYSEWVDLKRLERHMESGTRPRRQRKGTVRMEDVNTVRFISE